MDHLFNLPMQVYAGQAMLGLMNGAFYAILSLGLAVIFGLLRIVNFTHGAQYMLGACVAWAALSFFEVNYWVALLLSPLLVGAFGALLERLLLSRLAHLDHLYGLLLTFSIALIIQGLVHKNLGSSSVSYPVPAALSGAIDFGFLVLPAYRVWVVLSSLALCLLTWLLIEKTRLGAYLRAATENPALTESFGLNVPLIVTATYGVGVALAAFAGVLAAPIYSVSSHMGSDLLITVFAVVVIGGMGSILGSIATGFGLGLIEGMTKVIYAPASEIIIFIVMIVVLLVRPVGIFGRKT